ncbi:hypothetical protein [uncultured Thiothrix sp.]|jgi:hypothetical protein|uniref:hypothetical protein n=1 Tax=uncultured Thiothrix sp. TaxID=223185 RepID=UPI00261C1992|nr:hypothetical protein [uncultured Thiothrix sp.]HMT93354.1 hypothetical protein [Thiolinea sp.]
MSDEKKDNAPQPSNYVGTLKVNILGKDYYVQTGTPPMSASLEELERALKHNRTVISQAQDQMKAAVIDQMFMFKPPMLINFDSPTQNAIMAHININILIPLINLRGGNAVFEKAETFHVKSRIEIMRNAAERVAYMEQQTKASPVKSAFVIVVVLALVMSVLLVNQV